MADSEALITEPIILPVTPSVRDESGRFIKGISGNPAGGPKRKLISDALRDQLEQAVKDGNSTQAEQIAASMINQAVKGRVDAATFVRDTTEGKPVQAVLVGHTLEEGTARRLADLAQALRLTQDNNTP